MSSEYPKNLFRDGDSFEWEGRNYDGLVVQNGEQEAEAIKEGWRVEHEAPVRKPRK